MTEKIPYGERRDEVLRRRKFENETGKFQRENGNSGECREEKGGGCRWRKKTDRMVTRRSWKQKIVTKDTLVSERINKWRHVYTLILFKPWILTSKAQRGASDHTHDAQSSQRKQAKQQYCLKPQGLMVAGFTTNPRKLKYTKDCPDGDLKKKKQETGEGDDERKVY